jgi:CRP-like cAMP-binding protein
VVALSPMSLLVLDQREFRSMLMTTPSIGVKMLAHVAERLAEADTQLTD